MWNKIEFFILIIIIGMKGFVQGSCLEYGHSCWGAHGKRSDKTPVNPPDSIENIRFNQNSKDLLSDGFIPQRYVLLNILLKKDSLINNEENLNHPIVMNANEIDYHKLPDLIHKWNLNKFQAPLRKRGYFRQDNQQLIPSMKSRIVQNQDLKYESTFDHPYNVLRKSSKPTISEKSHNLQFDIYSDEDQNLQDFPLK